MLLASCVKDVLLLKIDFCTEEKLNNRQGIEEKWHSSFEKDVRKIYKRKKMALVTSLLLSFLIGQQEVNKSIFLITQSFCDVLCVNWIDIKVPENRVKNKAIARVALFTCLYFCRNGQT